METKTTLTNIAAYLPEMARRHPLAPAVYFPQGKDRRARVAYTHYTFAQLDRESNRIACGLEAVGIRRGTRTVLMVPPSLDFFALTFALFKVGAVPVLVDPGMGVKNLKACLAEAEPEAFIGIAKAHVARQLFGWSKESLRILLTVGRRLGWGGKSLADFDAYPTDYAMAATAPEETAAILFTSGSTGVPKGAIYSHGNFLAQVEMLRSLYGIEPGEIDLPTFPLFALFAPALGMTSVIPDMDFTRPGSVDPRKIVAAIESFGVTGMFGSPALINRVGRYGQAQGTRLPSLRRVISAGAPVPAQVLERFAGMLDDTARIHTPYGATEALPVCSIDHREILDRTRALTDQGRGVCVGRPVPGIAVEVIAIDDGPIAGWDESLKVADGVIGEIVVKGPQVTTAYVNRPESTDLAKIADPEGGFYHRMGDLGYRDAEGRLWFCGRKAHRVVTQDATLFTIPCEAIFNTHPQVFRSALVGIGEQGQQRPVICIELEKGVTKSEHPRLRRELLELGARHELTAGIRDLLFHPAFPVDIRHNAKIFREKLAVWAQEQRK
ncbi:fatty acid CoA ligase family protein [Trichloromonas acetexigens]|uniref:AMP-binding protein n=1 Tax=Trichloromonas acetexigens TaxID=38815 RepID=A0A550JKS1_9BACT|nr:fatty acid CoA ligase family protein [Desulfuromonas acetexigens]TRO83787.1 AMP-binding protein [Desulfuromonas acetexigens]